MPRSDGRSSMDSEAAAFHRRIARMDEQLRRLQNHDFRPQLRGLSSSLPAPRQPLTRPGEDCSLPLPRRLLDSPGCRLSASWAASPVRNESPEQADSPLATRLADSDAFRAREQQLLSELAESQAALEKMASLVHDREEQIRRLAVSSPPEPRRDPTAEAIGGSSAEQTVRDRARVEVLRAELQERDLEVRMLRSSEKAAERRAAEQMRAARLELAETRRQQEILGLEIREAELHRQRAERAPLQLLLQPPADASPEEKRERLREAVQALKQLVQDLALEVPPEPREPKPEEIHRMPCIPEEESPVSVSPVSPVSPPCG
ncbi:unnamed protein product [Effrenium voratum]|uniref:Uncharacterized protein n=1 Tax=Effrenium voratum TaxID=2562239 RepID=A0AA36J7L7_9DINO|nr:unnamed protein product [Effrenium voratum]CAJ1423762.1 unnamed protein product [Effrenium voratum]